MKKRIYQILVTFDLWVTLVTTFVFVALYFLKSELYLNELLIVISSIVSLNLIVVVCAGTYYVKQFRVIRKEDSRNY